MKVLPPKSRDWLGGLRRDPPLAIPRTWLQGRNSRPKVDRLTFYPHQYRLQYALIPKPNHLAISRLGDGTNELGAIGTDLALIAKRTSIALGLRWQ
jgi:hypothetical protein